jgi:phosphoglycolate phosphatase
LLAQSCVADYFEVIVGMGDVPHPKPAPDPILTALDRLGVSAREALFVGDSGVDALCAQQAQVGFSAHLAGYCEQASDLLPNVFSFSNYAEFTRQMLGQNSSTSVACHA